VTQVPAQGSGVSKGGRLSYRPRGRPDAHQIGTHALRAQPMRDCAAVPPGVIERRERKRAARSRPESSSPVGPPSHEQDYDTGVSGETVNGSARLSRRAIRWTSPFNVLLHGMPPLQGERPQPSHFMAPRPATRAGRIKRSAAISNKPLTTCAPIERRGRNKVAQPPWANWRQPATSA
jgi:hypothetical protein